MATLADLLMLSGLCVTAWFCWRGWLKKYAEWKGSPMQDNLRTVPSERAYVPWKLFAQCAFWTLCGGAIAAALAYAIAGVVLRWL